MFIIMKNNGIEKKDGSWDELWIYKKMMVIQWRYIWLLGIMELKKYWLSDELWICKEKNDGYSSIINIIMINYGIEKKDG